MTGYYEYWAIKSRSKMEKGNNLGHKICIFYFDNTNKIRTGIDYTKYLWFCQSNKLD